MPALGDVDEHFWLTRSVARTIGLNLGNVLSAGRLTLDDYAHMIARCQAAGCGSRCADWLGRQSGGSARTPPPFCVHVDQFKALRLN